jgi:hypothetical protein
MGHSLGIRGQRGRVKVGYQTAAHLGAFTLSPTGPSEWSLDATVTGQDEYWMAQEAARTLELEIGEQRWIWRTVRLVVDVGNVHGTLTGRPERR